MHTIHSIPNAFELLMRMTKRRNGKIIINVFRYQIYEIKSDMIIVRK